MCAYRVSSRCNDWGPELTRDYLTENICSKIGNLTSTGVKVPLYLTGKADCVNGEEAKQSNKWMDPVKKADVCCFGILGVGPVGCRNEVDEFCECNSAPTAQVVQGGAEVTQKPLRQLPVRPGRRPGRRRPAPGHVGDRPLGRRSRGRVSGVRRIPQITLNGSLDQAITEDI